MDTIIRVTGLVKQFRDVRAVDNLSFTVPKGQVYGFLGQNGAGKSTTIRMLLTLITPDEGDIEIFGMNLRRHRREILRQTGAVIERPDMYKYLTALENLRLFATMSGMKATEQKLMEQLDQVGLASRAHSKVKTYSQGMKQRLGIATALVHDPGLIILDEPINGLDPQGIAEIRNLILSLSRDRGKTIFISSHLLSEMELIADSMLIIDKGKKLVEGRVRDLFDPAETLVMVKTTDDERACKLLAQSSLHASVKEAGPAGISITIHRDEIPLLVNKLVELGVGVLSLESKHSLENYFLSLTGGQSYVEAAAN